MEKELEQLERKLAEWIGLAHWHSVTPLNFTLSLDACFKHLVPKLTELGYWLELQTDKEKTDAWLNEHLKELPEYHAVAETPALALCRAVEKLIEGDNAKQI